METKDAVQEKSLKVIKFTPKKDGQNETTREFMQRMEKVLNLDEVDEICLVAFTSKGGSSFSNRLPSDRRVWMLSHAIRQILNSDLGQDLKA